MQAATLVHYKQSNPAVVAERDEEMLFNGREKKGGKVCVFCHCLVISPIQWMLVHLSFFILWVTLQLLKARVVNNKQISSL